MFKSSYDCVDIYDRNALDLNRYRLHSSTVEFTISERQGTGWGFDGEL